MNKANIALDPTSGWDWNSYSRRAYRMSRAKIAKNHAIYSQEHTPGAGLEHAHPVGDA